MARQALTTSPRSHSQQQIRSPTQISHVIPPVSFQHRPQTLQFQRPHFKCLKGLHGITCDIVGEPCPQRPRPQRPRPQRPRPRPRCRIHIRTSTGRPTHTAPPYTQPAPRTARPTHTAGAHCPRTQKEPRPRPTGIWDEAGARSEIKRGSAHSLTPPAVRPETMYFCRYWNSRITGTAARTAPAAKMPHGAVRSSAAHMYMPTARVN